MRSAGHTCLSRRRVFAYSSVGTAQAMEMMSEEWPWAYCLYE